MRSNAARLTRRALCPAEPAGGAATAGVMAECDQSGRPRIPAVAYSNRGAALLELGRPDDAVRDFDQAVALDPWYAEAYNNRSSARPALGDLAVPRRM